MASDTEQGKDGSTKRRSRKKQLYQSILKQMEFYFSDSSLAKDRFLSKLLEKDGKIDIAVFLSFNKIRSLTSDINDIVKALRQSEMLTISEDAMTVARITPVRIKENTDQCTVYVEQLPPEADHDWLKEIFSPYGPIDYISVPKYRNGKVKGFGFVEFSSEESANAVIEEYKKADNYLPIDMEPEALCSIITFSEPEAAGGNMEQSSESKKEKGTPEEVEELKPEKSGKEESEVGLKEDNSGNKRKKSVEEVADNGLPDPKKLKSNDQNEESSENDGQLLETDEDNDNCEGGRKRKHRKKKKKPKKEKITAENSGLQILSKMDWKKLRNKYLNIQKEKMKNLKKHLSHKPFKRGEYKERSVKYIKEVKESNKTPNFPPGLIVRGTTNEPIFDLKKVKGEASAFPAVKYVDVKEGAMEIFFRLETSEAASQFCQSAPWSNLKKIEGKEEADYWEKIETERAGKMKKKTVKERGKKKLVRKAEKALGKHIIFDDVDD